MILFPRWRITYRKLLAAWWENLSVYTSNAHFSVNTYLLFFSEEDEFGTYAAMVLKHYLAEGVVNDHSLLLASQDIDTKKLVCNFYCDKVDFILFGNPWIM